jgi:hypothetical protein
MAPSLLVDHCSLQALPASLQARIATDQCASIIRRNSHILGGCDDQFLARFMMRLHEAYLMPGETLLKHGEIARELKFIVKGTLVITDSSDALVDLVHGEGTAPSVIGAVSFLMGAS